METKTLKYRSHGKARNNRADDRNKKQISEIFGHMKRCYENHIGEEYQRKASER